MSTPVISLPPRRVRRIALTVTAATASVLAVAGCSSSPAATDKPATSITVWTGLPYDSFQKPNAKVFEECAKETGITAKQQDFPAGDLTSKALQAATSHKLPDLLYLDGGDLDRVAETGVLTDLTGYGLSAKGYSKPVAEMGTYKGVQYGLAPGVNPIALFYNKDMFDKAGVAVPTTFAELRAAAKALTTPDVMGIALSADTGTGPYHFEPYLLSAGGDPAHLDTPAAAESLQLWKDFVTDGSTSASAVTWGWDAQDYFRNGKAAMVMSGSWMFGEQHPFTVGSFPVPTVDGKGDPKTPLGAELWTVPVTDKAHQAAAAKVLACITDDTHALEMASESGRLPGNVSVGAAYAKKFPEQASMISLLPNGYVQDSAKKGKQYEQMSAAIQDVLVNNADPAAALKKAAAQ